MSKLEFRTSWAAPALLLVLGAVVASAPLAAEGSAWSVAVSLGQSSVERDFGPDVFGWRVDDRDEATGIEVGYDLHRNLGFRVGYQDLGTYNATAVPCEVCLAQLFPMPQIVPDIPTEVEFTSFTVAAVPRLPLGERFQIYGKIGMIDWRGSPAPSLFGVRFDSESDRDLLAGLGAEYGISERLGVRLEYEDTDLFQSVSLGANWHF